jgi:hypothetical protein
MPSGLHEKRKPLRRSISARHAAPRKTRRRMRATKLRGALQASSGLEQRVFHKLRPCQPPELAGAVIDVHASAGQWLARQTQTQGLGAAVISGLVLAWLGMAVTSNLDRANSPAIEQGSTQRAPYSRDAEPQTTPIQKLDGSVMAPNADVDPDVFVRLEKTVSALDVNAVPPYVWVPPPTSSPTMPGPACDHACNYAAPEAPPP